MVNGRKEISGSPRPAVLLRRLRCNKAHLNRLGRAGAVSLLAVVVSGFACAPGPVGTLQGHGVDLVDLDGGVPDGNQAPVRGERRTNKPGADVALPAGELGDGGPMPADDGGPGEEGDAAMGQDGRVPPQDSAGCGETNCEVTSGQTCSGPLPYSLEVSCYSWLGNVHLVEVAPGDEVTITVDTANEEYASDFFFLVTDELGGACLAEADDNFECSYPPPSYACPGLVYEVPPWSRGRLYLYVALASDTCTNENRHDYVLRVLVNGCPAPAPSEGDVFDVINIDGW